MYERHHQPLASRKVFASRLLRNGLIGLLLILFSEKLSWLDSLLNASMILSGMGPVNPVQTTAGKLFASFYALYSGIVPLTAAGVLAAPILHRFLHHFHLADEK